MSKEIWGIHPSTGLYVSDKGRVITERKGVNHGANSSGYRMIKYDGKNWWVHRLVAEAFIPNPENKPQVNHKNGDKTDNRVENLEWATREENLKHAYKTGLKTPTSAKGEAHANSKLTEGQVREIKQNIRGLSQRALGKLYGVSQALIGLIQRGETWKHVV